MIDAETHPVHVYENYRLVQPQSVRANFVPIFEESVSHSEVVQTIIAASHD